MSSHTIALAGNPNCGKSALFNALTGSNQKVGNYPGVTVEKKFGEALTRSGEKLHIIDLPGTYSLDAQSVDERIAIQALKKENPEIIVVVADATNLERTLGLAIELRQFGKPLLVALNMMDLAQKRGLKLDLTVLRQKLQARVIPTIAIKKSGTLELLNNIDLELKSLKAPLVSAPLSAKERFAKVDEILAAAIKEPTRADVLTRRIDNLVLHPFLGPALLATILLTLFQAVFTWAEPAMDLIESSIGTLGTWVATAVPSGEVQSLLVDGVIAGVGAVVVFLPQILILFFFIFLLEGSGYMSRAALIMDKLMAAVGLHGRAFVPLLSSFACAIPGIMATRTIKSPRDRLVTILIAPLMTCSARLPVYVLLIGAFIPNIPVIGPLKLQGLVMFGLFLAAIVSAIAVAWIIKKTMLPGNPSPLLLELPTYKLPNLKQILINTALRGKTFLKRAGTLIMGVAVVLWFLSTYPKPPADYNQPAINYSLAGQIGKAIEPIVSPAGFDWRIATGLIPGFAAREVMVGALATVFAIEAEDEDLQMSSLQDRIREAWPIPVGLALLMWYIFAPQCLATFAVAKRETAGWKYPIFMFVYMLALAYLAATLTYQIATLVFT